jgi:hypothetical protein
LGPVSYGSRRGRRIFFLLIVFLWQVVVTYYVIVQQGMLGALFIQLERDDG